VGVGGGTVVARADVSGGGESDSFGERRYRRARRSYCPSRSLDEFWVWVSVCDGRRSEEVGGRGGQREEGYEEAYGEMVGVLSETHTLITFPIDEGRASGG
jgi:hypothetical protein